MKKIILLSVIIIASTFFLILGCKKDKAKEETTSPAPTTVAATSNSTLNISGTCWTFNTCTSNKDTLTGVCGTTTVTATFGTPPILGVCAYTVTGGTPAPNQIKITVINAPGQPSGVVWYAGSGLAYVISSTVATTATFSNIPCMQLSTTSPTVDLSGSLTCQ